MAKHCSLFIGFLAFKRILSFESQETSLRSQWRLSHLHEDPLIAWKSPRINREYKNGLHLSPFYNIGLVEWKNIHCIDDSVKQYVFLIKTNQIIWCRFSFVPILLIWKKLLNVGLIVILNDIKSIIIWSLLLIFQFSI